MIWYQDSKWRNILEYFKVVKYKINIKPLKTFLHTSKKPFAKNTIDNILE